MTEEKQLNNALRLKHSLSPLNVWALSFGGIIGWGAFVMPGTVFLPNAGPLGIILAMLLGGMIMLIIGANFCYMAEKFRDNGGSFIYTRNVLGADHAFLAAWSLGLAYLSLIWANATAFVLITRYLFGNVLQVGFSYKVAGYSRYGGGNSWLWPHHSLRQKNCPQFAYGSCRFAVAVGGGLVFRRSFRQFRRRYLRAAL